MKLPRPSLERGMAAVALVVVVAFATSQFVAGSTPSPSISKEQGTGQAGLKAVIDPETGRLATGAEASRLLSDTKMNEDLSKMFNRSTEGLVPVMHPDGRVSVDLQGRFMNATLGRVGPDGKLEQTCVENADEARVFLNREESAVGVDAPVAEVR